MQIFLFKKTSLIPSHQILSSLVPSFSSSRKFSSSLQIITSFAPPYTSTTTPPPPLPLPPQISTPTSHYILPLEHLALFRPLLERVNFGFCCVALFGWVKSRNRSVRDRYLQRHLYYVITRHNKRSSRRHPTEKLVNEMKAPNCIIISHQQQGRLSSQL